MTSMIVIVPTRGRPESMVRLHDAFEDTALRYASGGTRLVFAVDDDDPELETYQELAGENDIDFVVGPRLRLVGTLNAVAQSALADGWDVVGFMGDDHIPRTMNWDANIVTAVAGAPGRIVYGNDLFQGPNLPTAVFMDARVIKTLGYMAPPTFTHLYVDNCWKSWGDETGNLVYLPDTVIEHLHPQAGKADWDPGHIEVNSGEMYDKDSAAWNEYLNGGALHADIAKLKAIT